MVDLPSYRVWGAYIAETFLQGRSKSSVLEILNMFDSGVGHLGGGKDTNHLRTVLTFTQRLLIDLGKFDPYLEAVMRNAIW